MTNSKTAANADPYASVAARERYVPRGLANTHSIFVARAEGTRVWDISGKEYLDFTSGIGVLNTGWARTPAIFEAYRNKARVVGRDPTLDRLAYMALIGVGETREEGHRRADQILDYSRTSGNVAPQFANPPGYVPAAGAAQMLKGGGAMAARATRVQTKDGTPINPRTMTVEQAIEANRAFAGRYGVSVRLDAAPAAADVRGERDRHAGEHHDIVQ